MAETKITFDAADDYERFMGAWSRSIGEKFLAWLDPPKGARWLDVGCGTGAFSELVLRHCAPKSITGIDPSREQIEFARRAMPKVKFEIADAMDMPFGENEFDIVVSALVLHFIPDRLKAFAEMKRVLRRGGLVAGYTWERSATSNSAPYAPVMSGIESIGGEMLTSPLVPEGSRDGMRATLTTAGFADIAVTIIEATRTFRDFDDFWEVQTLSFSPPGKSIARLDEAKRASLREHLRAVLPAAADGSITYASRALSGKARKPE
jgi:SAM-dependent methyltransferase